jgi:hypothetical protein
MTTKRALAAAAVAPHLEKRGPDAVLSCPVLIIQVVVCASLAKTRGKRERGEGGLPQKQNFSIFCQLPE